MQSSVGIRERIDHVYPSLRPAERAVAQYIRDHIEEAADLTVGQMADLAHETTNRRGGGYAPRSRRGR